MQDFGCHSMAGRMTRVMMRRPGASLRAADPQKWHYNSHFDAEKAIAEFDVLARKIAATGCTIRWIEDAGDGLADAMFTRDASIVTRAGAVLFQMGKPLRRAEPDLHGRFYAAEGIPVLGRLEGEGRLEGGDLIWLDATTLVVGYGFRSNREGARQLQALLAPQGIEVIGFDLPVWDGAAACLHLMSVISPLTERDYLVHPRLIPTALWQMMEARGIRLIVAPEAEFTASLGLNLNVLPMAPGDLLMIEGFDGTRAVMEAAGMTVQTYPGTALCMACEGGPTCLTQPLLRD